MGADVLIVGQGLAGTLLGWELERAGLAFEIADPNRGDAASAVAAGIINPITGRRLVKSWRIEALLPLARATYREMEATLGLSLWRDMRIRRRFADDGERERFARKWASGELAPLVQADADGHEFWITDAARLDVAELLAASRRHWQRQGRLRSHAADPVPEVARYDAVIDCRGLAATSADQPWSFVPWEFSKGETLELRVAGLASDVILHRREWVVPIGEGRALVGATHVPGVTNRQPTAEARGKLEAVARDLLGAKEFSVTGHHVGVRVNLPDKRPAAGRHPHVARLGLCNALGAKGALWAPWLAREWVSHLTRGAAFDPEVEAKRCL